MHVLREHNGTKTEFYRSNTKSQGLVPAHFALIIMIVVHVHNKTSIIINEYMQNKCALVHALTIDSLFFRFFMQLYMRCFRGPHACHACPILF